MYKVNIKSTVCLYISKKRLEYKIIKFYLQWHQSIRYFGRNFVKDVQDLYAESYEMFLGKTKEDLKEDTIFKDWKTYCG